MSTDYDRICGIATPLRDRTPSFVAGALDALITGQWSATELRDRLVDVSYVLGRYLVALAVCAYNIEKRKLHELMGKSKSWEWAMESPRPILGRLAREAPRPPFTTELLEKSAVMTHQRSFIKQALPLTSRQ